MGIFEQLFPTSLKVKVSGVVERFGPLLVMDGNMGAAHYVVKLVADETIYLLHPRTQDLNNQFPGPQDFSIALTMPGDEVSFEVNEDARGSAASFFNNAAYPQPQAVA